MGFITKFRGNAVSFEREPNKPKKRDKKKHKRIAKMKKRSRQINQKRKK